MHLFLSAGEPSGDQHGAGLMRAVRERRPAARFTGFGGPEMTEAGQDQLFRTTDMGVMGVTGAIPLIKTLRGLHREAVTLMERERPDGVVLIDWSGFNWHVARSAKALGIPVHFYMPPQLWAWGGWRIRKVRKHVDTVLSGLPFEADWYESRGVETVRVPHPFFDEIEQKPLDASLVDSLRPDGDRVVAVLPGSRNAEVRRNFPIQIAAMRRVAATRPEVRFEVACYRDGQRETCEGLLAEEASQNGPLPTARPVRLHVGKTSEVIEAAEATLMVSGSVSLEVLARRTPAVVCYNSNLAMIRFLGTVRYISLPNWIAGREVMPEFAFFRSGPAYAERMAAILGRWLDNEAERQAVADQLDALAREVQRGGGAGQAADAILQRCEPAPLAAAA